MDHYVRSNVPHIRDIQRETAQTVKTRIDEAIERMHTAISDSYDSVSVFSVYWESDDTGSAEDSSLFIQTVSKLQNRMYQRSLSNRDCVFDLGQEVARAARATEGRRKLFNAGHAIAGSTPDSLFITPIIDEEKEGGPEIKMSVIKDELKCMASELLGLDVLLVMNSCCADIAEWGRKAQGARVELMATTTRKGIDK